MILELDEREAALVMAALRNWQDYSKRYELADEYEAYFEFHEPLTDEEIDVVCARLAEASLASRKKK